MSSDLETKDGEEALEKMMEASPAVSEEVVESKMEAPPAPATPEAAKPSAKAGESASRKPTPAASATSASKPTIQARKSDPFPTGSVTPSKKNAANLQRSPSGVGGYANATGASSARASTGSSNMRGRANTSDDVSTGGSRSTSRTGRSSVRASESRPRSTSRSNHSSSHGATPPKPPPTGGSNSPVSVAAAGRSSSSVSGGRSPSNPTPRKSSTSGTRGSTSANRGRSSSVDSVRGHGLHERGINPEVANSRKKVFTADEEAAKRAEVLDAYQNRPKITEGEVPIAMHGPGVDMKVVQHKAELNKLVLTKDKLAEERKKEQAAYKARGGAATVVQAPVDYSQQRSDGALERWIKIHFVDFIVNDALQQISVLAVAAEKSATFQQTRQMADGKYATYEHTLRVGNEVVLLSEQEQASTGRGWDESAEERMGVGQVKDFVEDPKRGRVAVVKFKSCTLRLTPDTLVRTPLTFYEDKDLARLFRSYQESIGTTEDLTKAQFKDLAMKTFLQSGMKPLPDPRDLDAAFYVADLDHNGTIDMFEFTTLVKDTQAGKVQNLGKPLQQNNALTTSNALIKANEDWSKRGGKPTVGTAPKFASDDIINRRASQKAAIVDPTALQVAGDGPAGLLAILRHHDVADQDSLIRLRRLNVSTASHLSFLTVSAMLEAGFNRVQARKLEIIGMQAREAERRRAMEGPGTTAEKRAQMEQVHPMASPDRFEMDESTAALTKSKRGAAHRTQAETTEYLKYKSRAIAHEDLTRAKAEYSARDKMTVPQAPNISNSTELAKAERRKIKAAENFRALDVDGNGGISLKELVDGASVLGLNENTARDWYFSLPKNENFEVDMELIIEKFLERPAGLDKSAYGLDHRGYTQAEARHADERDLNRKMTHAGLAQAKDQYNARPRDENGKVKTTKGKGFSLWRSLMRAESAAERRKAKAVENFRALDVDGNGALSLREVVDGAHVLGMNENTARDWYFSLPKNEDHEVDMEMIIEKFLERPAGLEKSAYALDHRGYTQAEARHADERDLNRKMTHAGLAQAKVDYNARPRDENGKIKTTEGKGFSLWRSLMRIESNAERRKLKAVEDFRALDVDGNGGLSLKEVEDGAHILGMNKSTARDWWFTLPKNQDNEVEMELIVAKYLERPAGLEKTEDFTVSKEEMNNYYRNIRDPEALAKEKEDYNKRVSAKGKTTTFSIFNFFFTSERETKKRAALEANPEKLAEYEARRSAREVGGTKEDHDKIAANMRRASHAELAAAKEEWDRRKDEDTGMVSPTKTQEFVFQESKSSHVPPPPSVNSTVSAIEIADYNKYNAERRAADLKAAKEAWAARAYDEDGNLRGTVHEEMVLSQTNVTAPSAPPTEYEWGVSKVEIAKAQKDMREDLRKINEEQAERFHQRMAAKAKREGRSVPIRRPSYSEGGVSKTAFGVSSPGLRSQSTDSRRSSSNSKTESFSRVSIPDRHAPPQPEAIEEDEDGFETEESGEEEGEETEGEEEETEGEEYDDQTAE